MAILPAGSILTFTNSVGPVVANVAVSDVRYKTNHTNWERPEFSHPRLLSAPNVDGSKPVIATLAGNRPLQYLTPCNANETVRPLTPDDSVLDSMYQRFDIRRWDITGANSLAAEVDKLFVIAKAHQVLLGQFDGYQSVVKGDVSYQFLTGTLQSETFAYLTATTLSMTGNVLGGTTFSNLLIVDFQADYAFEIANNSSATPGTSTVISAWTMSLEQRVIVPARSATY